MADVAGRRKLEEHIARLVGRALAGQRKKIVAWLGDPITYTIVVRNSTTTDTTNVRITDTLPLGVIGTNLDTTRTVTGNSAITLTIFANVASNVSSGAAITTLRSLPIPRAAAQLRRPSQ